MRTHSDPRNTSGTQDLACGIRVCRTLFPLAAMRVRPCLLMGCLHFAWGFLDLVDRLGHSPRVLRVCLQDGARRLWLAPPLPKHGDLLQID